MKQIDIIRMYSQKRCLVVDDNPDVRTSLKRILGDFGCQEIESAGQAIEAIDCCERHSYDIVLADYNLGKGKNGQQLLEELRHLGLLKNTAIYIMITAESAVQHVLHALECQPDDYLSKPINRDSLRPRLDAVLLKNDALAPVYKALDLKRPKSAIDACEQIINENERYQNDARKILGELLCKQALYTEAKGLYEKILPDNPALWVRLGWAKSLIGLKRYSDAENALQEIIEENQYCVDAHDLLTQVYEATGKYAQAQHAVATAINISPMSANRQRVMGRVSAEAGDDNAAAHAYRAAIKHSKNSCTETPEDYTNLADTLSHIIKANPNNESMEELATEALTTLKQVEKKYPKQPVVKMRSRLLEADIYQASGKEDKAISAHEEALQLFQDVKLSVVEKTPSQLCIDCAKAFLARGLYDEGERLLQEVSKLNNDQRTAIKIDKLLREPVTKEGIAYAAKLNKRGIEFHKQHKYTQAVKAFQKVLSELPNHVGLNLNLVQSLLSKSKEAAISDKERALALSCIQRIGKIDESSQYYERYTYLIKRFNKLEESS